MNHFRSRLKPHVITLVRFWSSMQDIASFAFDIPIFTTQKFDLNGAPLLVVGGGGGDSKTGVKNKLVRDPLLVIQFLSRISLTL
jgi:hypothetical protein